MRPPLRFLLLTATLVAAACAAEDPDLLDGEHASFPSGKADGAIEEGSPEALAVLALVNDPAITFELLDDDAQLHRRAAEGIIARRPFATLAELDQVPYVGPVALQQLLDYAIAQGYLGGRRVDVIFSPQQYADSHSARVAEMIDAAQHTVDIAMYSYSDGSIADALERAVARGVEIRFIFETANEDRRLTGAALDNSKSARLERMGINVRYVNKIMHHKFLIVDGPRDVAERARTASCASGSGNWSNGAATRYDENTVFFTGYPELTLRLQREFNLMWDHSRDFVYDATLPYTIAGYAITDDAIAAADEAGTDVLVTSDNFDVSAGSTTFRINGGNAVSDRWVEAIERADSSILIASGHLRSRPIAEALIAKRAADPDLEIRVLLDGQEYISEWYHGAQLDELDDCLAAAGTSESKIRGCLDKGFLFGYQVGQSDIDVRYKYYAYRWHYAYAVQMHHKFMVIDGDELYTGSYNLSDNAEHNTFENVLVFRGPELQPLVAAYVANFDALWNLERGAGVYEALLDRVATAASIPLVFDPMSLTWSEVTVLKDLIRDNCALINSEDYRVHPENHWFCPR